MALSEWHGLVGYHRLSSCVWISGEGNEEMAPPVMLEIRDNWPLDKRIRLSLVMTAEMFRKRLVYAGTREEGLIGYKCTSINEVSIGSQDSNDDRHDRTGSKETVSIYCYC